MIDVTSSFRGIHAKKRIGFAQDAPSSLFGPLNGEMIPERQIRSLYDSDFSLVMKQKRCVDPEQGATFRRIILILFDSEIVYPGERLPDGLEHVPHYGHGTVNIRVFVLRIFLEGV